MTKKNTESNDDYRKRMGHLFNNGDYCQLCGCGSSFAPTEADLDFQICEGKRPDTPFGAKSCALVRLL